MSEVVDARTPPQPDLRPFRPDLTPTWVHSAAVLADQRPPFAGGAFRAAWLGCRAVMNPAVAAAVHPETEVVAWDPDPARVAALQQMGDEAGLANLDVHERPTPPGPGAEELCELVVIDGLLDSVDDERRSSVLDAAGLLLRPGGLLVVTYRTVVGWSEVAPLVELVRHLVHRAPREHGEAMIDALALVELLRDRGAAYIAARPMVQAWVDDLLKTDVADVVEAYVHRDLRPLSHAQVAHAVGDLGATFVGDAGLDDTTAALSDTLAKRVRSAPSPVLREALADLATRRAHRADLFRLGSLPLLPDEGAGSVAGLRVIRVGPRPGNLGPGGSSVPEPNLAADGGAITRPGGATAAELWPDASPAERGARLRRGLSAGWLHPVVAPAGDGVIPPAAARLTALLDRPGRRRHTVVPTLGTALPSAAIASLPAAHRRALGVVAS